MSAPADTKDQAAAFALLDLIQGSVITQALYVAARLSIADVLSEGPLTAAEIASRVAANPEAVHRLLRLLSGYSVFAEDEGGRFGLTPVGAALSGDAPDSMRGMALLMGHPLFQEEWRYLLDSVRTGKSNLPVLRGMGAFEFLMSNPEYGAMFMQGMGNLSAPETDPVVAACDFSSFRTIIDLGGGRGALLAGILSQASGSTGILFDRPEATVDAPDTLKAAGVTDRCTIEHGSYFESVPAGGDAYLLKHTLHDFGEEQIRLVLQNIRNAIGPSGSLFVIEYVLPEGNERHIGNVIDLWLLLMLGAKERTAQQYTDLFATEGFRLSRIIRTASPVSIIEAKPV